jgi:hypothetical protein
MRWSFKVLMVGVLASSSLLGSLGSVQADPAAEAGRAIASKWQSAIVTLQIVSKVRASMYGEESSKEMKQEVTGIVIDPSGLVVTSQIGTNVTDLYTRMMDQSDSSEDMKTSSEITSLKIILSDGK